MIRRLWQLYRRELGASRTFMVTVPCLIVLWNLFLLYQTRVWPMAVPGMLSLAPLFLTVPWAAIASVQSWRRQWQDNTVQLTLALPMPGWSFPVAKSMAVITETALYAAVAVLAGLPLLGRLFRLMADRGVPPSLLLAAGLTNVPQLLVVAILVAVVGCLMLQLAYLTGRLVGRWGTAVLPLALVLSLWALLRIGAGLNLLLVWVPPLVFRDVVAVARGVYQLRPLFVSPAPFLSILAVGAGYLRLIAWLLERQVDV